MSQHYVSQIIHALWSTKHQKPYLTPLLSDELYPFISALLKRYEGRLFCIGGINDHIHVLFHQSPKFSLSEVIKEIKSKSSKWLSSKGSKLRSFGWQEGYTAFSVDSKRIDHACQYIRSEEQRHRQKNFQDELKNILKLQDISFMDPFLLNTTYTKLIMHLVWSTKNRLPFLQKPFRNDAFYDISVISNELRGNVLEVGGIEDHMHLMVDIPKNKALSDFIREVKSKSTHRIQSSYPDCKDFSWQSGYAGFSVSVLGIEGVRQYIQNQEEHHRKVCPNEEMKKFLQNLGR